MLGSGFSIFSAKQGKNKAKMALSPLFKKMLKCLIALIVTVNTLKFFILTIRKA